VTVKNCSYVDQQKISDFSMVGDLGFPGIWKELFHSANVKTSGVAELDPCGTGFDLFLKLARVAKIFEPSPLPLTPPPPLLAGY
jgi:hypothetical protein